MKQLYRVLAYGVAVVVALQAAAIAYALFSMGKFVDGGGTLDKSTQSYPGVAGLAAHGIGGEIVIPLLALALLVVSFFAKVPGGTRWGVIVFVTVVLQVLLGLVSHAVPALGVLHGVLALVLFALAGTAAMRVGGGRRTSVSA